MAPIAMATPTLAPSSASRRRILLRVLAGIIVIVLAGGVGLAAWFVSISQAALPQIEGTIQVAGLTAPVEVIRDRQGVPHITAANLHDLFFAQGYVTAQDRLWAMDATRRFAGGQMAEIFGESYLRHDRQQRILGLQWTVERAVANLGGEERARFQAYADGVNAFIAAHSNSLPPEFRLLGYQPKPWTISDCLLIGAHMSQMLNFHWVGDELARERAAAKLGPELTAELYPNRSWRDHPPTADLPDLDQAPEQPDRPVVRGRRQLSASIVTPPSAPSLPFAEDFWTFEDDLVAGSNNWALSGLHTASGKPLLSNDMHLGHQIPNIWYEAQLTAPGIDVAGVTLPGVPYVIVGHNQRIAWGFTNLGPAVTDLYVETFNDKGEYQTPGGWTQPQHRNEVIKVKGGADVNVDVTTTRHGPIITDIIPGESRKLALKWVLYDSASSGVPFFDINTAQNWDEFCRAFEQFAGPSQNVVYADVDGHIGYHATGKIPIRTSDDFMVPVNGSDNTHEWRGYVPFDQLPHVLDPPSGVIGTANGRITPDGYPYILSYEWGGPQRTERIYRVLSQDKKFTAADMLALQTDIYSEFDRFLAQRLAYAVDHSANASPRARQAADILRNWDGKVTIDSAAPTITATAREQLVRLMLEPKLGPSPEKSAPSQPVTGWKQYRWFMSSVWLENALLRQPKGWLPDNFANYDALLASAVEQALTRNSAPRGVKSWRWGRQRPLNLKHPVFGSIPVLQRWAGPGYSEQSGNGYTVKQVGSTFGPSERMTVDLSNLDASTLNVVNGQSGNLFSPHFDDQWNAWYHGTTFMWPFSPAAVEKAKEHALTLAPAS